MSYELIVFTRDMIDANGFAIHDNGLHVTAHPATHSSGRKGYGFTFPTDIPQLNGLLIRFEKQGKMTEEQRGKLIVKAPGWESLFPWELNQTAAFIMDDFFLQDIPPPVIIEPPVPPNPPTIPQSPFDLIKLVYRDGNYDLSKSSECGRFTENCCAALHEVQSVSWGHIHKTDGQNGWPPVNTPQKKKHAIDAIMLLNSYIDGNGDIVEIGIYDIIFHSESPDAKPAFNRVDNPHPELWYYPA